MLILSRHLNEVIVITTSAGERITVMVTDIHGDRVKLGVQAVPSTTIHREEIQRVIDRERRPL